MPVKRPLVRGTIILGSVNLYNRCLGVFSQAMAVRLLGTQGYGLYQLSMPIFTLCLVLATAGIPPALTRLVADESSRRNLPAVYRAVRWSFWALALLGVVFAVLIAFSWPLIARFQLADHRIRGCLLVLGCSLPVIAAASSLRAYFQGVQRMGVPALAQMLEQTTRVAGGLYMAYYLLPLGIGWAAAGYASGVVMGEAVGLLLMLAVYCLQRGRQAASRPGDNTVSRSTGPVTDRIAHFAAPATLNRLLSAVVLNIEAVLIPRFLLQGGCSPEQATALYGQFMGVALTLITIPGISTLAVSANLLPAVANARARGDTAYIEKAASQGIKIVLALSLPITVVLCRFPQEITHLVFGLSDDMSYLRVLALGGVGLYLIQITNGILYGLNRPRRVLVNTTFYSLVRIALICVFMSRGSGLLPLAWAYLFSYLLGMLLNIAPLYSCIGSGRPPRLSSSLAAAGFMLLAIESVGLYFGQSGYPAVPLLLLMIGAGLTVYGITLLLRDYHLLRRPS
ncbi:MAG: polysaccharide biosynthesis protein [Firmicutes bacterium]|nr:polysaccharide biosynthesis protein [Bacillota bacterium]